MTTISEQKKEAKRLKTLFKEKSTLTQKDFAQKYGLGTPANFGQYLNGYRPLNVRLALMIANALDINISEFSPRLAREVRRLGLDPCVTEKNTDAVQIPVLLPQQVVQFAENQSLVNLHELPHVYGTSPQDDNCMALFVESDPIAPDYLKGDTIIFNPVMEPAPGDDVVAIWREPYTNEMQCTVRGYILTSINDSGESSFELQTRIASYQPLSSTEVECKVLGVVIEFRRQYKLL